MTPKSTNILPRDITHDHVRPPPQTNSVILSTCIENLGMVWDEANSVLLCLVYQLILLGNPYNGKASDMWAMGVLLYTMLYGQFPFYDEDPQELFRKIRAADFNIPRYGRRHPYCDQLMILTCISCI